MAISATHLTTNGSDVDATSFTTASITPTANALVLAAVAAGKAVPVGTATLTGNGLTWVEAVSPVLYDVAGTGGTLWLFRAMGASPSAGTVGIDFGGVTHLACVWSIVEFTGVDTSGSNGSGAVVQSVGEVEIDLGNTASVTLAAFSNVNNATFGAAAKQTNEGFTPGTDFLELGDFAVATPVVSVLTEWQAANDTTVDCSWATAGEKSGIIGVEVKAAAAGGDTGLAWITA